MNFKNPNELLKILLDKEIDYRDLLEISQELEGQIETIHKKINLEPYPSPVTQCILECFKIKNGFSKSVWQSAKYLAKEDIKNGAKPVKFTRIVTQGNLVDYEIYNIEQLNIKEETSKKEEIKTETDVKTDNKSEDTKGIILACIKEFDAQYGKSGIAKILKGSQSLKGNEYNNASISSKHFGALKEQTMNFITSKIDELIESKLLIIKKVSFGRPILCLNPEKENEIQGHLAQNPSKIKIDENDDENVLKILHLIKQGKNVFITGHAGTGKSYILNKLKEKLDNLVITSTTGIAAVNVKGQTIHSWAGVGICNRPVELTVEKIMQKATTRNQIQNCEILAVDEISMLNIKTFEYVDVVLKQVRGNSEPFGGIQVIFIGDFFQLPPVEDKEDNAVETKYCFESNLWQDLDFYTVQLNKNYRQNEKNLIDALSHMRMNMLNSKDIALLNSRQYDKNEDVSDILHIFATNSEAENYNNTKFNSIRSKEYNLAAFDGVYNGKNLLSEPTNEKEANILNRIDTVCSAERIISLKIGARVMLLVNLDFEKGLINGSCGKVEEITDDYVLVKFDNGKMSKIRKHDFEFYKNDVLIAVRKQFPLRLAYGITIHKSQGMSLDKLVVDCSRIFEKGQAYVALSRIKTLDGLYLRNFDLKKVMVDEKVANFYNNLKIFDESIEYSIFNI